MKKRLCILLSLALVISMSFSTVAYASDPYELPPIPAHTHSFGDWVVTKEPTCTEDGRKTCSCSGCSVTKTDIVPALGHDFGDWFTVENEVSPSCTEAGTTAVEKRECSRCDAFEIKGGEVIDALDHNYEAVVTPPTCTEKGYTTHTCSRCNNSYVDTFVDSKGHSPKEAVQEKVVEPTHETGGSYDLVVYCSECDKELSRETVYTNPNEHTAGEAVEEKKVAATCTTDGSYDLVVYCSECNAEMSRTHKTIAASGHALGNWTPTADAVDPTCITAGSTVVETRYCDNCDYSESRGGEVIGALGHNYDTNVTEPTCTERGYTTYSCTRCDKEYVDDYTDALGHTPGEAVKEDIHEATANENGYYYEVVYCTRCEAELSREKKIISKTGIPVIDPGYESEEIPFDIPGKQQSDSQSKPAGTKIIKIKKGKKRFTVKWLKVAGVNGYQVQYSTNKKFKKKYKGKKHIVKSRFVKKTSITKKTVKKLKSGKKYYVRVRTYKIVNGKKVYSNWSKAKAVRVK